MLGMTTWYSFLETKLKISFSFSSKNCIKTENGPILVIKILPIYELARLILTLAAVNFSDLIVDSGLDIWFELRLATLGKGDSCFSFKTKIDVISDVMSTGPHEACIKALDPNRDLPISKL